MPDPANPQSFNRYSYTLNNPVKYRDPSGHCAEEGDESCWEAYHQIWQFVMDNPDRFFSHESSVWNDPNWWVGDLAARSEEDLQSLHNILISDVPELNGVREYGARPPLDPDYVTAEANIGAGTLGIIRDREGNIYVVLGIGLSGYSLGGRIAMGARLAEQVPIDHGLGLEWELNTSDREEHELERDLTGLSFGISGGMMVGVDVNATLRRERATSNLELGVYSPQVAGGLSYGILVYDAGSPTPLPWQR